MAKIDWAKNTRRRMVQDGQFAVDADGEGPWVSKRSEDSNRTSAGSSGRTSKKKQTVKRKRKGTTRPQSLRPDMVPCPFCNSYCRRDRLEAHAYKIHGKRLLKDDVPRVRTIRRPKATTTASAKSTTKRTPQSGSPNELVECTWEGCTARVKSKKLQRHIERVHQTPHPERPSKRSAGQSQKAKRKKRLEERLKAAQRPSRFQRSSATENCECGARPIPGQTRCYYCSSS